MNDPEFLDIPNFLRRPEVSNPDDLIEYGYAGGKYNCKCIDCGLIFLGDKRASRCQICATELMENS